MLNSVRLVDMLNGLPRTIHITNELRDHLTEIRCNNIGKVVITEYKANVVESSKECVYVNVAKLKYINEGLTKITIVN
jgi:hypothetical protein